MNTNTLRLGILNPVFTILLFAYSIGQGQDGVSGRVRTDHSFRDARSLAVDPAGTVYVADAGENKLFRIDVDGKAEKSIGGYGWGELEFDGPVGISASNGLDIFVADRGNHRIQRFNRKLEYIATLFTRDSDQQTQRFGYPMGVAVTRVGDVLVCDGENRRVVRFSRFNRFEQSIGGFDAGRGRLHDPRDIAITTDNQILVLDGDKVVVYDEFGNYMRTIGAGLIESGTGMSISDSLLLLADASGVLGFDLTGKILGKITTDSIVAGNLERCLDVAKLKNELLILLPTSLIAIPFPSWD